MKKIILILLLSAFFIPIQAQTAAPNLFDQLKVQDSIFFERGFNQCDMAYLEMAVSDSLKFYHDKSGFQDKAVFMHNTRQYICPEQGAKPIRKRDENSLEVFPLYKDGKLYGAIQNGVHRFYLRETGKEDVLTGTARFSHVWLLQGDQWKLSVVLSYDH